MPDKEYAEGSCGEESGDQRLAEEDLVREKIDASGRRWRKVYFGGGPHFRNWLEQSRELCGDANVEVEEIESKGLACFDQAGEKMYRIWVRASEHTQDLT